MENTKTKASSSKAVPLLIVLSVTLGVILLAVTIAFWQQSVDANQTRNTLEGVYSSAYYSMVDSVNNLHVDTAKFETLPDVEAEKTSLKSMSKDCEYILASLAVLPIDMPNTTATTKFFNQINGMCDALIRKLDKDKALSAEDYSMITNVSFVVGVVKSNLNKNNEMVTAGDFNFIDASVFNKNGLNEFSSSLGDLSGDSIEYPSMIFDGPFSSALETRVVKGLSDKTVDKDEAMKFLKEKVFKDQKAKIKYTGKTEGEFKTHDFEIKIEKKDYTAQITEKGGLLVTLCGEASEEEPRIDDNKAMKIATDFAQQVGFKDLKPVWVETKENVSYINLAPVISNVIMYPDLIKVKIDLTTSAVIGWEARNYGFNHVDRKANAEILEDEAVAKLGSDYRLLDSKLAYIPLEDGTEVLTYELMCEKMDGLYYVYVNAANGQFEKILKVVETEGVKLLI